MLQTEFLGHFSRRAGRNRANAAGDSFVYPPSDDVCPKRSSETPKQIEPKWDSELARAAVWSRGLASMILVCVLRPPCPCWPLNANRTNLQEETSVTASRFHSELRFELCRGLISYRMETIEQFYQMTLKYEEYPRSLVPFSLLPYQTVQHLRGHHRPLPPPTGPSRVLMDTKGKAITAGPPTDTSSGNIYCYRSSCRGHMAAQCPMRNLLVEEGEPSADAEEMTMWRSPICNVSIGLSLDDLRDWTNHIQPFIPIYVAKRDFESRLGIHEDDDMTLSHYLNGLRYVIREKIKLYDFIDLAEFDASPIFNFADLVSFFGETTITASSPPSFLSTNAPQLTLPPSRFSIEEIEQILDVREFQMRSMLPRIAEGQMYLLQLMD
ncbi:hypothetical protein KSP39_PZI019935 [Platanthera zijinensis]|uniref:Uncharacterized protein n=1 Tax=Platanthera zijinensis TaxID=2320716 RepID=A0AAP0AZ93_9ASPA